jgi:hypothetical protein
MNFRDPSLSLKPRLGSSRDSSTPVETPGDKDYEKTECWNISMASLSICSLMAAIMLAKFRKISVLAIPVYFPVGC